MSVLIDEYMWVLSCCETYYYHSMIIFSNHWFLELVAMTASENHRNLRAITDYYGITNPRGFNADHTSDNRHYCYGVWKLKLSGYTLHSFYINQRCFFAALGGFRRFSLQNPSKWVRGLDAYSILLSITCPMIFSCRYLA